MEQNISSAQICCRPPKSRGIFIMIGMLFISAAIAGSAYWVSETFYKVKALSNSISVTGSAEKIVKSDTVKWNSSFSRTVPVEGLKDGSNQMKADLDVILRVFKQRGIDEGQISVQTLTITPICELQTNYDYSSGSKSCSGNRLSGFNFSQSIIVQSNDVEKVSDLSQEAAGYFIDQGVLFASQGIEFYYSKLGELKMDLIADATANAKGRAEQIATTTGAQIGFLQSAGIGVFQVTAINSTEISDYGYYDTSSIDKKVTAVVRASFSLTK